MSKLAFEVYLEINSGKKKKEELNHIIYSILSMLEIKLSSFTDLFSKQEIHKVGSIPISLW